MLFCLLGWDIDRFITIGKSLILLCIPIEIAQSELANALNSVELQHMVGWLATQYQRLAAKSEQAQQYSAAIGALNSLRAMLVQPQLDRQFDAHFRGRFTHQVQRR